MEKTMDLNKLIKRVINMLIKPKEEWVDVRLETTTIQDLFLKYAVILAAIPAVCSFLGFMFIPYFSHFIGRAFTFMILGYVLGLGAVFLLGFVIDALAPSFGAQKNLVESMRIAVYSNTAAWVVGVLLLIPHLWVYIVGAIYTSVLLFLGVKTIKSPPADKEMGYTATIILTYLVITFIIKLKSKTAF